MVLLTQSSDDISALPSQDVAARPNLGLRYEAEEILEDASETNSCARMSHNST